MLLALKRFWSSARLPAVVVLGAEGSALPSLSENTLAVEIKFLRPPVVEEAVLLLAGGACRATARLTNNGSDQFSIMWFQSRASAMEKGWAPGASVVS